MERLNKKQKEILKILDRVYPRRFDKETFLQTLGDKANDILADVKILEEHELVDLTYGTGGTFPSDLEITPKGKEKLKENFFTRIMESAHNNPWRAIMALLAIVSIIIGVITLYYQQNEKPSPEKPLLMTPDTRVQGNSIAEIKFNINNPSHSIDYYYISGSCSPEIPALFSQLPPDKNINQNELSGKTDVSLILSPQQNREIRIPAGGELNLFCTSYSGGYKERFPPVC